MKMYDKNIDMVDTGSVNLHKFMFTVQLQKAADLDNLLITISSSLSRSME